MPEKYKNIYGYFDFEDVYDKISLNLHSRQGFFDKAIMVEIGTWLGKSTCYMAELIKQNNYKIKFYGVDTFLGEVNATDQQDIIKKEGGSIYKRFLMNMKECGVRDFVTPLQLTSDSAAQLFDNESVDFVFLDAEHLYNDVLNDLKIWFPKVKKGGFIAGHDFYEGTQVKLAVEEFFRNDSIFRSGNCFIHQKK